MEFCQNEIAAVCVQHCVLSELHCGRGREYLCTGVIPECGEIPHKMKKERSSAEYEVFDINKKLVLNLRDLGHVISFLYEGKGKSLKLRQYFRYPLKMWSNS